MSCSSFLSGDQQPANDSAQSTLLVTSTSPDVWSKDNPNDSGRVPSGVDNWYISPDIWVRNNPDGGLTHQDPIEGQTNIVYVRLRNRVELTLSGSLDVSWLEPSLGALGQQCFLAQRRNLCQSWQQNAQSFGYRPASVQMVNAYPRPKNVDLLIDRSNFPACGSIKLKLPGSSSISGCTSAYASFAPGTNDTLNLTANDEAADPMTAPFLRSFTTLEEKFWIYMAILRH